MKYAAYDENGFITGWYSDDIHDVIPTPNVEVDDSVWESALDNGHNKITVAGVTSYEAPVITDAERKEASKARSRRKIEATDIAMSSDGYALMNAQERSAMETFRSVHFTNIMNGGSVTPINVNVSTALQCAFNKFDINFDFS